MNRRKIIRKIVENVRLQIVPGATEDWTNTDWTRNVLRVLCRAGRAEFGCGVWTTGHPEEANGPEWLYDQTWIYPDPEGRTQDLNIEWSILMVAECEWTRNLGHLHDDILKLFQARAEVRVMIIDAARWGDGSTSETIVREFRRWISLFRGSQKNDAYLIIAYEEETEPWNWRFFQIHSKGFGKKPMIREVS